MRTSPALLASLLASLSLTSASAATITFTISSVINAEDYGGSAVEPFTLAVSVSDAPLGTYAGEPGRERYKVEGASFTMAGQTVNWIYSSDDGMGHCDLGNDLSSSTPDSLDFQLKAFSGTLFGIPLDYARFAFFDTIDGDMLSSSALPTTAAFASGFDSINVEFHGRVNPEDSQSYMSSDNGVEYGTPLPPISVTVVPEPASFVTALLGGMAFLLRRRRR